MIYIYTTLENTLEQYTKWKPSESHVLLCQDSNERTDKKKTLRVVKKLPSTICLCLVTGDHQLNKEPCQSAYEQDWLPVYEFVLSRY